MYYSQVVEFAFFIVNMVGHLFHLGQDQSQFVIVWVIIWSVLPEILHKTC